MHVAREIRRPDPEDPGRPRAVLRPGARPGFPGPAQAGRHLRDAGPDGREGARHLDHRGRRRPPALSADGPRRTSLAGRARVRRPSAGGEGMKRLLAWGLAGLPFDARSRRALEETLADWRHEEARAATRVQSALAGLRGALSVVRVAALSVV